MSPEFGENENERRWLILRAKIAEENIKTALGILREEGVEPILIKGWAAAIEYPEKYRRIFGDIDLSVAPELYEKAARIVSNERAGKLNIDLHCGLRHLDTNDWENLFGNSKIEFIDDVPVRILCAEDHLRVLCVHWLTDGGAYRERLLDIFYLLQNNAESFDWEKCFGPIDEKRQEWIIKTIAVVHKYHGLDVSKIPFGEECERIPGWFIKALEKEWASGTKLQPIHVFLDNKKEFWKQLKKRFPPNAIQATVEMEGRFDEKPRVFYQFGSILRRFKPSLKRTLRFINLSFRNKFKKDV
jgi:hypothetical protein